MKINYYGLKYLDKDSYKGYVRNLFEIVNMPNMTPKRLKQLLKKRKREAALRDLIVSIIKSDVMPKGEGLMQRSLRIQQEEHDRQKYLVKFANRLGLTWYGLTGVKLHEREL